MNTWNPTDNDDSDGGEYVTGKFVNDELLTHHKHVKAGKPKSCTCDPKIVAQYNKCMSALTSAFQDVEIEEVVASPQDVVNCICNVDIEYVNPLDSKPSSIDRN